MNGAREYARLFGDVEQHGRLLIISGEHARGKYFHVWVMPEGGVPSHYGNAPDGSVEVYGILGGHPGWTEYYGWLHTGPWQRDFVKLVEKRKAEIADRNAKRIEQAARAEVERKQRIADALANYHDDKPDEFADRVVTTQPGDLDLAGRPLRPGS